MPAATDVLPYAGPTMTRSRLHDSTHQLHELTRATGVRALYDAPARAWHVWKFDDVSAILRRQTPGVAAASAGTLLPLTPRWRLAVNPLVVPGFLVLSRIPAVTANADANAPVHARVRMATVAAQRGLSHNPARLHERWGSLIATRAAEAAEEFAAKAQPGVAVDLATTFAQPLSAGLISEIVGDRDPSRTKRHADAQTDILGRIIVGPLAQARAIYGLVGLWHTMLRLTKERERADPTAADLADHLVHVDLADQPSRREIAANLMNIIAAGYSTTYGTMLNSVAFLLGSSGRVYWRQIADQAAAPALTRELTRLHSGLGGWKVDTEAAVVLRDAATGVTTTIPAGATIITRLDAANRDPEVYADPDDIRTQRYAAGEPNHLAFGLGAHACVGEHVAREELSAALSGLARALPNLQLVREPEYPVDRLFTAPEELRVIVP